MRLVGLPALETHARSAGVERDNVGAIEELGSELQCSGAIVLLEQVRVDEAVGGREGGACDAVELVDLGYAAIDVGGCQLLDRLAELALERDVLDGAREGLLVVEPEVALLAKADFVAHALVILDRRAA